MPNPILLLALLAPLQSDARLAPASREDSEGWTILHLAGKPRDIGYQYGALAADEIVDAHAALKAILLKNTGHDWNWYRDNTKQLFWDKVDTEYREEMEGQVEGLKSKGKNLDVWDVLAFNGYIEMEGSYLPYLESLKTGVKVPTTREACSAFIATGSATKDGKIVMGHNLWWDYTLGQRFKTVLDVKPEKGNRFMMDVLTGFIHSGSDFAVNSAGMVLCETTISGMTGFDPKGIPEFVRMRKAIQYGSSIDDINRIFRQGNNGGYANTWLIGDTKTNEIAKLELGLKNMVLTRTKDGAYVGANFPEDPKLIEEEVVGFTDDPMQNSCMRRKARWQSLLAQNKGQVDAEKAKTFLGDTYDEVLRRQGASDSTLCGRMDRFGVAHGAVNTKVVTSDLASKMSFWGRMGFSDGSTFSASTFLARNPSSSHLKPYLRDIPARPFLLLTAK
jgi:hypothetical protein